MKIGDPLKELSFFEAEAAAFVVDVVVEEAIVEEVDVAAVDDVATAEAAEALVIS